MLGRIGDLNGAVRRRPNLQVELAGNTINLVGRLKAIPFGYITKVPERLKRRKSSR